MNDSDKVIKGTFIKLDRSWGWEEEEYITLKGKDGDLKKSPQFGMLGGTYQKQVCQASMGALQGLCDFKQAT